MADITVGSFVRVPKGTMVFDNDSTNPGEPSRRDLVVEVREIVDFNDLVRHHYSWFHLLRDEDRVDPARAAHRGVKPGDPYYSTYGTHYQIDDLFRDRELRDRLKAKLVAQLGTDDFRLVGWSTKRALIAHVQPAEAPVKKEKALTVKQKMVKGSRWRIREDAALLHNVDNPAYWPAVSAFHAQNPKPRHGHQTPGTGTFTELADYLQHHGVTEYLQQVYRRVKAGQEFRVTGKMKIAYRDEGHNVPVRFDGETKDTLLGFSDVRDIVEELEVPVVRVFVLRDRATGEVFAGWSDNRWVNRSEDIKPEMTTDWRKMHKFEDMGRLKQFVLEMTGYYKGMDVSQGREYWQEPSQTKMMDLPETWEAMAYDKLAKKPIETLDIQQWHSQAWRLRTLTINFGSPVRTLYKTLENKDELSKYKGMLVIRMPQEEYRGERRYTDEATPEDLAAIDSVIDGLGFKRGEFRKAKDKFGAAVTFARASDALMAKLAYTGNMRLNVINLDTMQEVIDTI